ncbi:acetate--CoA ligase [Candidatus Gottesmanbacteria bacterium]|nr:acetate--CoA ligase [Candidatus Gottesmanbacteria bacterium]
MKYEVLKKDKTDEETSGHALHDYDKMYASFSWKASEKEFVSDDGCLNAAYVAIDRHVGTWRRNKLALIFEDEAGFIEKFTFEDLSLLSNKVGNILKDFGAERGDRVFLFLPRTPYLYISFLAILKIGGVAGALFSAFQEQALFDRLEDSSTSIVITTSQLLPRLSGIRKKLKNLKHIITVDTDDFKTSVANASADLRIAGTRPDDHAFMLYTSGTTGKPKGVVHVHKAIVHQAMSARLVLDLKEDDTYWCTADPGWITGISYEILGNLALGITTLVFSGRFDPKRWYTLLAAHKVTVWYTAPTAIRMLMAQGVSLPKSFDLSNLRHLCSVGEPLNPEAIRWSIKAFGRPFHDTWFQTETGAIMIANFATLDIRVGSMGKPMPGVVAAIVDDSGRQVPNGTEGNIALRPGWPAMMQAIWKRLGKYHSYFINGWYMSGDHGTKDGDGYFWFIGRADDVIKTSGERVGPFEVESALVEHPAVVEAGVIGKPDELRGEIIKAFVVLDKDQRSKIKNQKDGERLKEELMEYVKKHLAGHAYPREIEFIDSLPKTRSGKIMRRILKAKELGLPVGDTSTLEEY